MVKDRSFYRTLLMLALPVALKALISRGVSFLDNMMVSSLGETAFASVALANQTTNLFTFFVMGVGGGASVLISQYWGKRELEPVKSVFSIVFSISTAVALAVTLLIAFLPGQAMSIVSDRQDIIQAGVPYISIVCFSYLLFALSETMTTMLRCVELVQVTLWSSIAALATNLVLNYVLIFGKLGLPAMGVAGAAIATVISRAVELAIVAYYLFGVQTRVKLRVRDFFRSTRQMWADYARYGAPIIAGDIQWGLVLFCKAIIIGHLGKQMVAAYQVADSIIGMAGIFSAGLGSAACVIIGKSVGEGDYKKTRQYSNTLQILFACGAVVMCTLLFLVRAPAVSLFKTLEPDTAALAVQFLSIGALTYLGTFFHAICFTGINRGAGDGKFVFKVDMICGWLIVIPLSYLASQVFHWPLLWVFLCLYIDQCFKWIIAFFRLRGDRWIRNVTRA